MCYGSGRDGAGAPQQRKSSNENTGKCRASGCPQHGSWDRINSTAKMVEMDAGDHC